MAKVYLDSGDTFSLSGAASVFGSTGTEKVIVNSGVTGVVVDANVERVDLPGASSAYTFQQAGNQLKVLSGATVVATIPLQDDTDGTQVVFTNGSVSAKVGATGMTLGGAAVTSTAAAVTPTTIDATVTSGSGSSTGGTTTGQTFSLTTAVETKTLTSGNDTVDGSTVANSISGDFIADASTSDNDVLNLKLTVSPTKPTISNIETINASFDGFGLSFDASGVTNSTIKVSSSTSAQDKATITGLANSGVNFEIGTGIATLTLGASTAGVGSSTVKLAGGTVAINTDTNNLATLTLNSAGASDNNVVLSHNPASMSVTGNKNLTVTGNIANFDAETVTNSLSNGATLTFKNSAQLGATVDLSRVAATGYDLSADSNTKTVKFAAGTTAVALNHVTAHAGTFTASGTGSADVLNVTANKTYGTGAFTTSGYETVNITDASTAAQTLTTADFTGASVAVTGAQSYTFASGVTAKNLDASGLTGSAKLTVVDFGNGTATASTITGTANSDNIIVANNATEVITVNAGEGANTVSAKSTADTTYLVVIAGAGSDTITGGGGNDTILSGGGNDTITLNAGSDLVQAGAGDDIVVGATNVTVADVLVGGDGTDTLTLTDDDAAATNELNNVSGFENITLASAGDVDWTSADGLVAAGATLTLTQSGGQKLVFDGSAEKDGVFNISAAGNAAHSITGGAGADALTISGTTASALLGGAGADTLTFTSAATGANSVTGGAGADTIAFGGSTAGSALITALTDSTTTSYDAISGFTVGAGSEKLDLSSANLVSDSGAAITFAVAANVTANAGVTNGITAGVFTFDKALAVSLTDAISKVGADVKTAGNAVVFAYGSDTYFFADVDGAATTSNDILIKLSGVTTAASMTAATEVFTLA